MPNQILADATASADIRSTTVVTSALPHVPNFADPKLGQLLRLQEADYQDAIDQLATEHEQRRRALPNQTVPVATATDIPTAGVAVALVLVVDSTQCLADIELLAQAANRSLQVRHHLFNLCQPSLELAGLDLEVVPTVNASECGIRFQLPHAFRQLALALRAGEFDAL